MSELTGLDLFRYYTRKAGDIGRQLALGAIALIWILHEGNTSSPFEPHLKCSLYFIIGSLIADIIQYVFAILYWLCKRNETKNELEHKKFIYISSSLIVIKLACMIYGYIKIWCHVNSLNMF
jgi:hypothetical protein